MDDTAFRIFKLTNSGFCCTQIMVKLALEEEEKENTDLIRAANGLCAGIGYSQKTCGVLTGGIIILSLYAGKGEEKEYYKDNYNAMMREYIEWFEEEFERTDCRDMIGIQNISDDARKMVYPIKCGETLQKAYEKVMEILYKNGYEFGDRD